MVITEAIFKTQQKTTKTQTGLPPKDGQQKIQLLHDSESLDKIEQKGFAKSQDQWSIIEGEGRGERSEIFNRVQQMWKEAPQKERKEMPNIQTKGTNLFNE